VRVPAYFGIKENMQYVNSREFKIEFKNIVQTTFPFVKYFFYLHKLMLRYYKLYIRDKLYIKLYIILQKSRYLVSENNASLDKSD